MCSDCCEFGGLPRALGAAADGCGEYCTDEPRHGDVAIGCHRLKDRHLVIRYANREMATSTIMLTEVAHYVSHSVGYFAECQRGCDGQKSAVSALGEYVISYRFKSGRFLSVYFEHDGWSDADFMQALRDGAHEDIVRAQTAPLERLRAVAAVDVAEWQIGREIEYVNGAWKLKPKVYVWRRIGETEWSDGERGNGPTRDQLREGRIEPYRADISSLMDDMGFTWATQTMPWNLGKLQSARGNKREFDSADIVKRANELDYRWVADRVGFDPSTLAKRRWRDKKRAFPSSRGAIDLQELPDSRTNDTDREVSNPTPYYEAEAVHNELTDLWSAEVFHVWDSEREFVAHAGPSASREEVLEHAKRCSSAHRASSGPVHLDVD